MSEARTYVFGENGSNTGGGGLNSILDKLFRRMKRIEHFGVVVLQAYIYINFLFVLVFAPCQRMKPRSCDSCGLSCFLVPLARITSSDIAR